MFRICLSYRRTAGKTARRLADDLARYFGEEGVFIDVDDIRPGSIFASEIERNLGAADVVLVLVTSDWCQDMQQRLARPVLDYVRAEIVFALQTRARVIPVLIDDATLPTVGDVPADVGPLLDREAVSVRDSTWRDDVERLVDGIGRPYSWRNLALRSVVAVPTIVVAIWAMLRFFPENTSIIVVRVLVGALVASYAAIEWRIATRKGDIPAVSSATAKLQLVPRRAHAESAVPPGVAH